MNTSMTTKYLFLRLHGSLKNSCLCSKVILELWQISLYRRYEDILSDSVEKKGVTNMCDVADRLENKGRKQMMFSLVQDGTLEISIAAQKIQMTVPEFEKAMTAAGYKIPAEV